MNALQHGTAAGRAKRYGRSARYAGYAGYGWQVHKSTEHANEHDEHDEHDDHDAQCDGIVKWQVKKPSLHIGIQYCTDRRDRRDS